MSGTDELDWKEELIIIRDDRPMKFEVWPADQRWGTSDPMNRTPFALIFNEVSKDTQISDRQHLRILMSAQVGGVDPSQFANNAIKGMQFAAHLLANGQTGDQLLTTEKYAQFTEENSIPPHGLRTSILKFLYQVNTHWPNEALSHIDLQKVLVADLDNLSDWFNHLQRSQHIIFVTHKKFERLRTSYSTCRINPAKYDEISEMLASSQPAAYPSKIDVQQHRYFSMIRTETELGGEFAFVLMPFSDEEFPQAIFDEVIQPTVKETLGINCVKVDNDRFRSWIQNKIFSHIVKAKFVIVELSTENPNVVFEFGLTLAMEKVVIPLYYKKYGKEDKRLSFDYQNFDTIFYRSPEELRPKLQESVLALKKNQSS